MSETAKHLFLVIPSLEIGGAERVFVDLANGFADLGYRVTLVALTRDGAMVSRVQQNVDLVLLRKRRVLEAVPALLKRIRADKPSVILSTHGHLNVLLGLSRKLGLFQCDTLLLRETSVASINLAGDAKSRMLSKFYKIGYLAADRVVCQSHFMKEDLALHFGMDVDRMQVIHNPIDIASVQRKAEESVPFTSSAKSICFVGRLGPVKQVQDILRALTFAEMAAVELHVVGDGQKTDALTQLSRELSLEDRVFFHGAQSNPYTFMKQADVVVLTSRFEGFPNVLVEAIAVGTPVCSYNCPGGAREIVCEDNGLLVEPATPEALGDAVQRLLKRPLIAETVKATATRFEKKTIVAEYASLF